MANFEAFRRVISSSINLLFLRSEELRPSLCRSKGSREAEDGPKRNLLINFSLRLLLLSFVCFFGALFFTFNGSWCMADSSVRPHQVIVFLTGEI